MYKWTIGKIDNLPYKCGKFPNRIVTNSNEIKWTFQKYVRTTKPPVMFHNLHNKNGNLLYGNVINGNDISTYDCAYDHHGELNVKSSMVITRQLTSYFFSIRNII